MLLGGVAMFLYGMSLMGDGLKKVAGNKLELILYRLSSTPLKGILLGTGVTAVIQSSSATSVMVVGFVNSAMMKLRQAIAIIMGAVIGTSITGWIICLSGMSGGGSPFLDLLGTESLAAMTAVAAILMKHISKKRSVHHAADILMGFSVLMFGMKTMSGAVSVLKEDPGFISFLTNFSNPALGILIGIVFTAVLQSASASVGILQALSATGLMTLDETLPIILGIAVGASVPVLLSGMGSARDGKRTAWSYLVIEVLRVILFATVFYGLNAFMQFAFMHNTMDMFSIALLNTLFRISTVIVLAPFIGLIEKLMIRLVPGNPADEENTRDMDRLEERFLAYPTLAVEQTRLTINKMAELTRKSMDKAIDLSQKDVDDRNAIRQLGEGWVAEETLAIAVYCAIKHADSFEDAIVASVNHDGDSDSTGAVTGNILGTALGYTSIPDHYLEKLELRDIIEEISEDLYNDCQMSEYSDYRDPVWESKYIYVNYDKKKRAQLRK